MILHGKNLIISAGGQVLAGAKSCSIDVNAKTIPVSSPTSGQWEMSIAGRKSWSLTTSQLMIPKSIVGHTINVIGTSWGAKILPSVNIDGVLQSDVDGDRGITMTVYKVTNGSFNRTYGPTTIDLYQDDGTLAAVLASDIASVETYSFITLQSYDAISMPSVVRSALLTAFPNLIESDIPLFTDKRYAFSLIGRKGDRAMLSLLESEGAAASVNVFTDANENCKPLTDSAVKDMVAAVGNTYNLRMSVDGYASDVLRGTAICQQSHITGPVGNLVQGSFSFKGSGPLE